MTWIGFARRWVFSAAFLSATLFLALLLLQSPLLSSLRYLQDLTRGDQPHADVRGDVFCHDINLPPVYLVLHFCNGQRLLVQPNQHGRFRARHLPTGRVTVTVHHARFVDEDGEQADPVEDGAIPERYSQPGTSDLRFLLGPGYQSIEVKLRP